MPRSRGLVVERHAGGIRIRTEFAPDVADLDHRSVVAHLDDDVLELGGLAELAQGLELIGEGDLLGTGGSPMMPAATSVFCALHGVDDVRRRDLQRGHLVRIQPDPDAYSLRPKFVT